MNEEWIDFWEFFAPQNINCKRFIKYSCDSSNTANRCNYEVIINELDSLTSDGSEVLWKCECDGIISYNTVSYPRINV